MRTIPPIVIYGVFALAMLVAISLIWRLWLFGFNPTLDDVLTLRCFGSG